MKNILYSLFMVLIFSQKIQAQNNLVPNPSFEDTVFCPSGLNQIYASEHWLNFGNTPDYYNACETSGMNVPNSNFGFQYAHTGVAYAGIIPWRIPTSPDGPNYREFFGTQLTQTLTLDEKYFFSFFVNYSYYHPFQAMTCNKLGLRFSTVPFDECCPPPINNFAHLHTDSILSDTTAWVKLSGSFLADSNYSYVIIGNFFDDFHTDTLSLSQFPDSPYYYIDDVCVTTDSTFNQVWTSIITFSENKSSLNVFPNPAIDKLNISSNEIIEEIQLLDLLGKIIFFKKVKQKVVTIHFNDISPAFYLLRTRTKNKTHTTLIETTNN